MLELVLGFQFRIAPVGRALCLWACPRPAGAIPGECGTAAAWAEGQAWNGLTNRPLSVLKLDTREPGREETESEEISVT